MNNKQTLFIRMKTIFSIFGYYKVLIYYMNGLIVNELKKLGTLLDSETPNEVVITKQEFCHCLNVVAARFACNTFARRISDRTTQWQNIVNGTVSEYAIAKWLGIHWNPTQDRPDTDLGDIGTRIQIRMTDLEDGCLIVKPTDPDNHIFVFVIGSTMEADPPYRFKLAGIKLGKDCKKLKWQREGGAYFVPQSELEKPNKFSVMSYS